METSFKPLLSNPLLHQTLTQATHFSIFTINVFDFGRSINSKFLDVSSNTSPLPFITGLYVGDVEVLAIYSEASIEGVYWH